MVDVSTPALEAFIDELINTKFADARPDEASIADIKKELATRLNQYLTLRTIEIISTANPEAVQKLSDLVKSDPTPEKVQAFISQYVSEPDVLVAQIFTDFRTLYLGTKKAQTN